MNHRPHSLNPAVETVHCLLAYKNFAANKGISHIGLGVSALNISQVLRHAGLWVDVAAVNSAADLKQKIRQIDALAATRQEAPLSHVVVSAPWIPTPDWQRLLSDYPHIHFAMISHSNVAFLHADPNGTRLLREAMDMQMAWHNFSTAANSKKFVHWALRAYGTDLTYLPNLFNLCHAGSRAARSQRDRPAYSGGILRIGCFGAVRVLKNHMTAAAALEIARRLGVDTEFWISFGRSEGAGGVIDAIRQMTAHVRGFTLRNNDWETWPQFHASIRHMNILLQPSFTESFNMVTADGVAEGVPSVVSESIEWVPYNWKAESDNALDIADKAIALMHNPVAAAEGWTSLEEHNEIGTARWLHWFLPDLTPLHLKP